MAAMDISDLNLPYSLDAEQSVLGSILLSSDLMSTVTERLHPEHFHIQLHNDLFAVLSSMYISGEPINLVTVIENSIRQSIFSGQDEAKAYLMKLIDMAISPSSIDSYAKIIEEKFMVRQLMYASKEIFDLATSGTEAPSELLDFAEKKIYDIRSEKQISGLTPIRPIVIEKIQELSDIAEHPENSKALGLHTSFTAIDKFAHGLNRSDLIILAARPGMGKTSFAMNVATNVAKRYQDKRIAVFSLEMSKEQIVGRMISSEAKITSDQMREGNISRSEWKQIGEAADVLSRLEVYIDDTPNIPIGEMKAKLRRVKNLGVVIIDYLQLMSTGRKDGNRVQEISEITRSLKVLAKELDVPVIVLSQLSRSLEKRDDKRPMLSDLRESGSIEQDADIVIFLYRNEYYDKQDGDPNACECIIAKNRHGKTDSAGIHWDGEYTRFTDVETIHADEY